MFGVFYWLGSLFMSFLDNTVMPAIRRAQSKRDNPQQ